MFVFNAMNKFWYIQGDEGCGEVSSKSCVVSGKKLEVFVDGQMTCHPTSNPDYIPGELKTKVRQI